MIKQSFFLGEHPEYGPQAIPLFTKADKAFEKIASSCLLPEVICYIEGLRPQQDAQYVLVNALGAGEWWSSNSNGDHFEEAGLIHKPDDWAGNPLVDKIKARDWPYGFPTFYNAHAFAHHKNKDPAFAYGDVEFAVWHDGMKRVELIVRVDRKRCESQGGMAIWDKLKDGQHPDVSMGSRVKFDLCSIHLDWDLYNKAQSTFDPLKHKAPDEAVLAYHKDLQARGEPGIRGLSITRFDYCEDTRTGMNKILPDGRKIFVYNPYPRFFDISFVFIGADKTAKMMLKIAGEGRRHFFLPSAEVAEKLGYREEGLEKDAAVNQVKAAKDKQGEIVKDVVPTQFAGKAVPLLTANEPDIPKETIDTLATRPLPEALATTSAMGVVLRPKEFQRIILIQLGERPLADELEERGEVFPRSKEEEPFSFGAGDVNSALARVLLPLLEGRSAYGPFVEKRVTICVGSKPSTPPQSPTSSLIQKLGSYYNGYRKRVLEVVPYGPGLLHSISKLGTLDKLASESPAKAVTALSYAYLTQAFMDEQGLGDSCNSMVNLSSVPGR